MQKVFSKGTRTNRYYFKPYTIFVVLDGILIYHPKVQNVHIDFNFNFVSMIN